MESVETSEERHLYVLPDIYHRGIRDLFQKKGSAIEEEYHLFERCIEWYQRHSSDIGYKHLTFSLLTSSEEMLAYKDKSTIKITSIVDFLRNQNSNLLDFVGFSG